MSKHEPRGHFKPPIKRPYTPAERRRWREDMRRFTNACKGVMQVYLVPAEDRALVAADPLPVSIGDEGCAFRPVVIKALNDAGRDWRPVCEVSNMDLRQRRRASAR